MSIRPCWHSARTAASRHDTTFPADVPRRTFGKVITFVRLMRVLLLLALTATTISLVIALARPETGATEKIVLIMLVGGCIYLARLITALSARVQEHLVRA